MLLKITIWAIFALAIAVKIYTKKRVQNIDGFAGITTRDEIDRAKRCADSK